MLKLSAITMALSVLVAGPAAAATGYLVDTGAPTSSSGLILAGNPGVLDWTQSWHAGRFTLEQDSTITGVEAWLSVIAWGDLTAAIYRAEDGLPPASAPIYSTTFFLNKVSPFMGWRGPTDLSWRLSAGAYWLNLEPSRASTFSGALWMKPPEPLEQYAESIRGDRWEYDPAGREGLDQFGLRITGYIPEPSTWAVLILGFGLAGAGLRGRRVSVDRT